MRIFRGSIAACLAWTLFGPVAAEAQTSPRIIMRRPLAPVETTVAPPATCGQAGLPACPDTNCDFVSATWQVGPWTGSSCGQDGTVNRTVQCIAVGRSGQRVPMPDSFCLQDASSFASSCSNVSAN